MQFKGKVAACCLTACAAALPAAAAQHPTPPAARQTVPEVRTRDLLLFAAGLVLLAGRRRPAHDKWQHEPSQQDKPRQDAIALQQQ